MKSIVFSDGTEVVLESQFVDKIRHFRQEPTKNESGGVLLGKYDSDHHKYYICDISAPMHLDKSGRNYFIRNKKSHQVVINAKWKESDGIVNYLGEWHTHPEIKPTPSTVDKKLIKQVILDKSNVFSKVFLIILGTNNTLYVGMANSDLSPAISDYKYFEGGL